MIFKYQQSNYLQTILGLLLVFRETLGYNWYNGDMIYNRQCREENSPEEPSNFGVQYPYFKKPPNWAVNPFHRQCPHFCHKKSIETCHNFCRIIFWQSNMACWKMHHFYRCFSQPQKPQFILDSELAMLAMFDTGGKCPHPHWLPLTWFINSITYRHL